MTDKLLKMIIRLDKKDASFVYFTLESNEGLCFYSTLSESLKQPYRDIEINLTESLRNEFLTVFNYLCQKVEITIISELQPEG